MTVREIEQRITEVEMSYQRQLALVGKPGYDPTLTDFIKKDLDWLLGQKSNLSELVEATGNRKSL
ncbi:MAG TPA: hypothetical protein VK543_05505 [Puia sp.]|nr:hypothetical protein [Puia sp.]